MNGAENQKTEDLKDQGVSDLAQTDTKMDQLVAPDALTCEAYGQVKVLLMVDESGSVKITDPKNTRKEMLVGLFD